MKTNTTPSNYGTLERLYETLLELELEVEQTFFTVLFSYVKFVLDDPKLKAATQNMVQDESDRALMRQLEGARLDGRARPS